MQFAYSPLKEDEYSLLDRGMKGTQTRYIGCIKVKIAMKDLEQEERAEVAKESIIRLCEATNIETDRKRREELNSWLDEEPILTHSGTDVLLNVTSTDLIVKSKDTDHTIAHHDMRNVIFARAGDEDTVDFIAYVAKNPQYGRACFVLNCGHESSAKAVLDSIATVFRERTGKVQKVQVNFCNTNTLSNSIRNNISRFCNTMSLTDFHDTNLESCYRVNNENQHYEEARCSLEKEPWFHGSHLDREDSEARLKQDGDFLVRESSSDFVLSVMHEGSKLHLLFDSMVEVRTKEVVFKNVSDLVKYHHIHGCPIVADKRIVFLRNGVRPDSGLWRITNK